jgi:hypothetical protein
MTTCRANKLARPSPSLSPRDWLRATWNHMRNYEPCGKPATHSSYGDSKPLCEHHAEEMRKALRSTDSVGNLIAGRARTEEEIAIMVRPLAAKEPMI